MRPTPHRPRAGSPDPALLTESRVERYAFFDRINHPYLAWQVEQFRPHLGSRVLEIGCGVGGIIDLLGPRERILGLDVDEEVLAHAARRFRDRPECHFELLDLTTASEARIAALKAERFDSAICVNVLEHIEDDLGALRRVAEVIVPGGVVAILVPAHMALYGAYDRLDGHFRRYAKRDLHRLVTAARLHPVMLRYFNAVGAVGWWVQYKLLRRTVHGASQFGLMNRLIPVMRAVERVMPPPFGLSVIAVARKAVPCPMPAPAR